MFTPSKNESLENRQKEKSRVVLADRAAGVANTTYS